MADYSAGNGVDGALSLSASRTEDTTCGHENITSAASAAQKDVVVNSGATFTAGNYVLLIQLQGTGAGNYEFAKIASIASNTLTMQDNLVSAYAATGAVCIQVKRYSSATINSGGSWTCSAWNGTKGGVLAAMIKGDLTVSSGGAITVAEKGFRGGAGQGTGTNKTGNSGEGYSASGQPQQTGANAGTGGGGGATTFDPSINGGGGGGYGAGGTGGVHWGGGGGSVGSGGGTSGAANLQTGNMHMGGGGGAGDAAGGSSSGSGGIGGGIIVLVVGGNISISAGVSANGQAGGSNSGGGHGGGAGGSIRLICPGTVALGTGNVTATAGAAGTGAAGANGGAGGTGRIATISASTVTGTSNPTIDETSGDTVSIPANPFTPKIAIII